MNEEALIYVAMLLVGLPVVIVAAVRGGAIGTGETMAGMLALLGVGGLVKTWRGRSKLPKARALRRDTDGDPPTR